MIDYKKFCFGACPRTGSTWVMQAAAIAKLGEGFKVDVHVPPTENHPGKLIVTLVRHPYEWLASYYFALQGGCVGISLIDEIAPLVREAENFEHFVLSYCESLAGRYSEIIRSYRGDSVIRTEDLRWGIIGLFKALGVKENRLAEIRDMPPINVNATKGNINYNILYLQEIVRRAERETYDHFDYGLTGDLL